MEEEAVQEGLLEGDFVHSVLEKRRAQSGRLQYLVQYGSGQKRWVF
jgi:hypothetical protein